MTHKSPYIRNVKNSLFVIPEVVIGNPFPLKTRVPGFPPFRPGGSAKADAGMTDNICKEAFDAIQ